MKIYFASLRARLGRNLTRIALVLGCLCASMLAMGAGKAPAPNINSTPRERLLLDFGWRFQLGDPGDAGTKFDYPEVSNLAKTRIDELGLEGNLATNLPEAAASNLGGDVSFVQTNFDDRGWRQLDLPHDWAVELPFDEKADMKHGFKAIGKDFPQNSIGWYRREFDLPASDQGKTLWVEFDGVFRNSLVWLNGHCLGRHLDGYSSFRYDISRFANFGGKNELVVRVDASRFEGWFYEGAGIYRHVWLEKTSPVAIAPDGVFVWTKFTNNLPTGMAEVHIQTRLLNRGTAISRIKINHDIFDPEGRKIGFAFAISSTKISSEYNHESSTLIDSPELWSPESPKLYKLVTTVESGGKVVDRVETEFGIRTIAFDADKGFLLNGKPYVIKGTCNHQDHAGVGSAIPDALQYWRIEKLKEMGCNAIRTSHNPPTPELLEACDRLGLLVMDENRRMDTNVWELNELKNLILRDRNHPSVFIWSIGNEEGNLQGREQGEPVAATMQDLVHHLDPTRPVTVAMNSGWGNGFSKVIEVMGFNYHTKNIEAYHTNHPAQPSIGSETASTRTTRGIYYDDKERGYLNAYGENGIEKPWNWWPYFATHPFTSGGFVWTGFDYRGEPTPYKWPCINSHFGLMDMCGFPKDIYFYYQAWWTDKPVLHLAPHWNWPGKEGEKIKVRCFSNCEEVELFVNGKSLGKQKMEPNGYLDWEATYAPGVLSAKGYRQGKLIAEEKVETTGAPARIQLMPDRKRIKANKEDISIINVAVLDAKGRVVPVADNEINFAVKGGKIIGVGNGDPSSHESDKTSQRKVFNGFAQVIVQSTQKPGTMELRASSPGLRGASVKVRVEPASLRPAVP